MTYCTILAWWKTSALICSRWFSIRSCPFNYHLDMYEGEPLAWSIKHRLDN